MDTGREPRPQPSAPWSRAASAQTLRPLPADAVPAQRTAEPTLPSGSSPEAPAAGGARRFARVSALGIGGVVLGLLGGGALVLPLLGGPSLGAAAWALLVAALAVSLLALSRARSAPTHRGWSLAGTALAVVGLLACAVQAALAQTPDAPVEQAAPPMSGAPGVDAPVSRPAPPASALSWGQSYTWADGLSIQVADPAPFVPSDLANGADARRNAKFTITVRNGGAEPYEFNDLDLGPTVLVDGRVQQPILDYQQQLGAASATTIPAGGTFTYAVALPVGTLPALAQLEFSQGLGGPTAVFAGPA